MDGMGLVERVKPILNDEKLLEVAKKRLDKFTFIGITENEG